MTRPRPNARWWMLGVLCLAILMVSLDITVLNVALPTIADSLHTGTAGLQWIVDAYSLAFAAAMLPAGLLGDRYGRKRVLLAGLALFRNARFAWGTAAAVTVSVALFGILFIAPQYLQAVLGYSAFGTGLRLIPLMAGLLVGGGLAGPIDRLIGTRLTVPGGLALLAAGLVLLATVHADGGYRTVGIGLALSGAGVGAAMAPAMDAVTAEVGDEAGAGSALTNTLRQTGGALAIAVLGSLLSAGYSNRIGAALAGLPGLTTGAASVSGLPGLPGSSGLPGPPGLPAAAAQTVRSSEMGAGAVADGLGPAGPALRTAAGTAFTAAMSPVLLSCAGIVLVGALLCLRFLPARRLLPRNAAVTG